MSGPRIVIAAGGTAGHVVPALAVADALRAEGAEVAFAGGERAEAELVPAAGYPLDCIRVEGISRTNPLAALRARRQGGRRGRRGAAHPAPARRPRGARRRRLRRRAGRPRRGARARAARAHRGRLAPRAGEPAARAARRARLPGLPAAGPRRRPLPRHRAPGAAARGDRAAARAALGLGPERARACSSSAARSARGRSTRRPSPPSRTRRTACCTSPAGATSPALAAPGPHYDLRDYLIAVRPRARRRRPGRGACRRQRSSSSPSTACRRCSCRIRTRPPTTRRPTRAGWPTAARRSCSPDAELTPGGLRAAVDAILLDPERLAAMSAAAARLARPDAAEAVARAVLAAVRPA